MSFRIFFILLEAVFPKIVQIFYHEIQNEETMKKKLLLFVTGVFALSAVQAQKLELFGMGSYNSTWLFNQNISDKGDIQDYAAGWGYNYGAGLAFYFSPKLGIEIDGLMNQHVGAYTATMDSNRPYTSNVKLNAIEIPVLFKLRSGTGAFFEVGPQIGLVSNARYTFHQSYTSGGSTVLNDTSFDAMSKYGSMNLSAVLGFGIKIKFGKHLGLKTGIRLSYGLLDLKGVDALGQDLGNSTLYTSYKPTNSASGGLFLGLVWSLGGDDNSTPPPPPPP